MKEKNHMSLLQLKNISKVYHLGSDEKEQVLTNINLEISQGEFVYILGPSGCGKSTLLNIVSGLDSQYEGSLYFKDQLLSGRKDKFLTAYRKEQIGFVFQNFNLISHMSVLENVLIPMYLTKKSAKEKREKAIDLLTLVGLESQIEKNVTQLSGGQKQRVAIARALANDPEIIIADEPTGSLDSENQDSIMRLFQELNQQGKTVMIVTHNRDIVSYDQHVVELRDGQIIEEHQASETLQKVGENKVFSKIFLKWREGMKIAYANFIQRKWRNMMIALATAIGMTGILLSLGLGNGISTLIEKDFKAGKIPTQLQVMLGGQQGPGAILTSQDQKDLIKKIGQSKIEYFEPSFGLVAKNLEIEGFGTLNVSETMPNYAQTTSLYENTNIQVPVTTKKEIAAGKVYSNAKEEGVTVTTTFLKEFN
ncbi:MAG: ABC transporter ATP-binding protein, partial [Bacteroidales bacterium]|nr:ABC transporter ATP-binding protein [Bacteroidales bacterium]